MKAQEIIQATLAEDFEAAGPGSMYGQIVCPNPNCGYRGPAARVRKGSAGLAVLLFLVFFPAAIVYILFTRDWFLCPECRMRLG